jgi:hypothetical protein
MATNYVALRVHQDTFVNPDGSETYYHSGTRWNKIDKVVENFEEWSDLAYAVDEYGYYQLALGAHVDSYCIANTRRDVYSDGAGDVYIEDTPDGCYLTVTYTATNVLCSGSGTGAIDITVTGGSGTYTYQWNDGATSQDRTGLKAGTYSVTVTDSYGTTGSSGDIVITEPTPIDITYTVTDATCFGSSTGNINITVSGGTPSYSYKWSDGSTLSSRINLPAGNYTLTVTDANSCTKSVTVRVGQPTRIEIVTNIYGKDVTLDVTGGSGGYTYQWSDGATTKDRNDLADGTYSIVVKDINGCSATATVVIDSFKFYFSKNPVWLQLQAENYGSKPNLSFECEVWIEKQYKSEVFEKIYSAEHPSRQNGSTDFDMQEVLNAYLFCAVPEFGDTLIRRVDSNFKRFYLQHNEKFGVPPVPAQSTQIKTYYVLAGGLSELEYSLQTFFTSYLDGHKPFLTWAPAVKSIFRNQHEYLHLVINDPLVSTFHVYAKIFYTDGTDQEVRLLTQNTVQTYEVYRIPAGVEQLGLASKSAKPLYKYELYLKSGSSAMISEVRTYKVVPDSSQNRCFLYQNSLGGWDTLAATGRSRAGLKTNEEVIEQKLPVKYKPSDREQEVISKTGQITEKISAGLYTNAERAHLVDFAISPQVYEITKNAYVPVRIQCDMDVFDEFEEMQEFEFDAIPPVTRKYTPEL